jgi:iron complex outermembrane recepter protein
MRRRILGGEVDLCEWVYQNLSPFLYIINKYTYETGNPYLLPQYSWTIELNEQYGDLLTAGVSYSRISNYFSQIFLSDTTHAILYYTQGNVGHVDNVGVSASLTAAPRSWWTMVLSAVNNQVTFGKGYSGELSAFYTTRARNDIQELLYPAGQVSVGMSKTVLKKKGTIKVSYRDIFYTGAMEGLTSFPNASEYFKIKRDSRVLSVAFTYRFGRSYKVSRHQDGASEEKERVQNG